MSAAASGWASCAGPAAGPVAVTPASPPAEAIARVRMRAFSVGVPSWAELPPFSMPRPMVISTMPPATRKWLTEMPKNPRISEPLAITTMLITAL